MRKQRSAAHPAYSIEYCLDFVETIYKNIGSSYYATRDELAKVFGQSPGSLQQKVSSCVQYGFLELVSKKGYKVTTVFTQYFRPTNENQKIQALIDSFKNPTIYMQLIERFEGDILPSLIPLSNILFQHYNISESACERAAEVFHKNANFLNLVSPAGILTFSTEDQDPDDEDALVEDIHESHERDAPRLDSYSNQPQETKMISLNEQKQASYTPTTVEERKPSILVDTGSMPFNIPLKGRRTAQVIIPNDSKASDFDTIINWVRLMKESYE